MGRFAFLILTLLLCSSANAILLKDLYTFNTVVVDNTQPTRAAILPKALDSIVLKVSGSRTTAQHPAIIAAKQQPDKYVREFSYKEADGTYKLTLNFDEKMINELVTSTGQGNLSKNRPVVIAWVAISNDQKLDLVGDNAYPEVAEHLESTAQMYGVPMVLPLLDLTERLFVKANDVVTFNQGPLQQAAGRYNADLVVAGSIVKSNEQWQSNWRLYIGDQVIDWTSAGADLNIEIDNMLATLTSQLLAHYTSITSPEHANADVIFLRVSGISEVADYAKIMNYLASLTGIKNVEVSSVNAGEAVFAVSADGGRRAIRTAIALDRVLVDEAAASDEYLSYKVNS